MTNTTNTTNTKEIYRIYGKHQDSKRFSPLGSDGLVTNLIHAYFYESYNDEDLNKLKDELKYLNDENPEYVFELRKV